MGYNYVLTKSGESYGHSVVANRILERLITFPSGNTKTVFNLFVMTPMKGQYIRTGWYEFNRANLFQFFYCKLSV